MVPDLRCYRLRHQRWPIQRYAQAWQCDNLGCTPELSLILLTGSTGAGKSTFARRLFKPTVIVSLDACRGLVANGTGHR